MASNSLTRINNNQISTASAGNAQLGINAGSKVQSYTITGGLLANSLTYGSDLTVTGNLTVNGTTTAVNTVNTLITDPLIVLADGQTSGTPTVDIGTIGLRGNQNAAVMAWKESAKQFVAALSNTDAGGSSYSNTTFNINSYADFQANTITANSNLNVSGTTSLTGNITSALNVTGTITGGNLATPGTVSATGTITGANITGSNLLTGGIVSSTGNATHGNLLITGSGIISTAGNIYGANLIISGNESDTGNIQAGNLLTGGQVSATGNITGGNILFGTGIVSGTGNISAGYFIGNGSQLTGVTASSVNANSLTGTTLNSGVVTSSLTSVGVLTSLSVSGNITAGNVSATNHTGTTVSVTGTVTAASVVGGVITGSSSSVTGTQTAASTVGGVITGSSTSVTGTQTAASTVGGVITGSSASVTGTVTAASTVGGVITGSSVSVTGNVNSGNTTTGILTATSTVGGVITGSSSSVTGTQTAASTVGGVITGSSASVTGTQTAASTVGGVITGSSSSVTGTQTAASTVGGVITGSSVSVTGNVSATSLNANTVYNSTSVTITAASGTITLNPSGNVLMSGKNINNLADPTQPQDAATKNYVDTVVQGLDVKASCLVATVGNLATATGGTVTYNNGTAGVGATLTTTGVYNLIDGGNVQTVGSRILVKNEANAAWNGIYTYTSTTVITRSTDFDNEGTNGQIPGAFTFIETGTVNDNTGWTCTTNNPVVMGTTAITWAQFSGAGSYTANTSAGISLTGTIFSALVDNNTTAFDGNGNIIVKASAQLTTPNIGAATGTSLSVTGTVTSSSVVGGVITGSSSSVTGTQTAASTVGGVITGSSSSVTGTQTAASTVGGVITGSSVSVTGASSAGSYSTAGGVTAASVAGGVITGSSASVTGNITGGNVLFGTGIVSGTGNVTGGNILFGTGIVSGTGNISAGYFIGNGSQLTGVTATSVNANSLTGTTLNSGVVTSSLTSVGVLTSLSVSGNITAGNVSATNHTGTNVSVTGTATAASTVGGVITGSSTSVTGTQTAASTVGGVITGSSSSVTGTQSAASTVGGVITGSSSSVTGTQTAASTVGGVITGSSASVTGTVTAASTVGGVITGSSVSVTGNVTGGNLISTGFVQAANGLESTSTYPGPYTDGIVVDYLTGNGRISTGAADGLIIYNGGVANTALVTISSGGALTLNGSAAAATFTTGGNANIGNNTFFVNQATGTASFGTATQTTNALVAFNSTTSILIPVGNSTVRPSTGVTGMMRFNTTNNSLEMYNNTQWANVGTTTFTVIADDQFTGNGSATVFTLSSSQTTNSCIVSINGVVQIPTTAYSVSGTTLTFTEAPAVADLIDVRELTTTTSVTSIAGAGSAVTAATNEVDITGNLIPTANVTYSLGNATNAWSNLYLSGSTIYLGSLQLKATNATTFAVYQADGSTLANVSASGLSVTSITDGTSAYQFAGLNGNAIITAGGANTLTVTSTGIVTSGTSSVTGASTAGSYSTSGTVTAASTVGGVITGSSASVSGTVTAASTVGGVITGSSVSVTGTVTGASLVGTITTASQTNITSVGTLGSLSVTGTVTGGNITTAGQLTVNSGANVTAIINGATTGVGNIGSSTVGFNTVFAKATTAQYADLAEKYVADAAYAPGTVLVFGGSHEVTVNATDADSKVAGVVSTNPGFVMNEGLDAEFAVAVALTGRVPTMVIGPVRKGDLMVAAGLGRARAETDPQVGTVIGKALEDFDGAEGTIEVVVGRF